MAGQPSLSRSKRHHFFHTSVEVTADGSVEVSPTTSLTLSPTTTLVLHPTTNLIASPEGSYIVRTAASLDSTLSIGGDTNINDNSLTGVQGGNTLHCRKSTLTTTDLTATETSQSIQLFAVEAGDVIYDVSANVTAGFKFGATATLIKIQVGDGSDDNGFGLAHLCGSSTSGFIYETQTGLGGEKGAYLFNASGRFPKAYTTTATIYAKFTSSGNTVWMASLDAGTVDVYVDMMQRQ